MGGGPWGVRYDGNYGNSTTVTIATIYVTMATILQKLYTRYHITLATIIQYLTIIAAKPYVTLSTVLQ